MKKGIELAIERAKKGGYDFKKLLKDLGINPEYEVKIGKKYIIVKSFQGNEKQLCSFEKLFCDPLFWRCLSKAERWVEEDDGDCYGWQYHWHSLIDNLIERKNIDDFFTNLLTK